jgi:kynureninase
MTLTDDKAQHESTAVAMDEADPLSTLRASFHIPTALGEGRGEPSIYFCGNSLGLQPRRARVYVEEVLEAWAKLGVDAHLEGASPWLPYHECFAHTGARLVGARVGEVVMMNSLTINLHLC